MQPFGEHTKKVAQSIAFVCTILAIFLIVKGVQSLKEIKFIGSGTTATNIISVSGEGEVFAVPDIAAVSFTTSKDAATMEAAQKSITTTANKAIDYLKAQGIAEKDIKTENYNAYPRYEWQKGGTIMCITTPCPQPEGKNVLVGYSATQTISIKIRKTDQAGTIVTGLGALGVTDITGPNFTIDNDDAIKSEARAKAITSAKTKADELAKQLGVKLVRIVNFSENGNQPYYDYGMYDKAVSNMSMGAAAPEAAPLPTGENKYTSNVTITYEIR